jgi:hypothetical protein
MTRPDVTLQPSKGVITQAAAQIFAAYVSAGCVHPDDDSDEWIRRSIRESIKIARTIDASVLSDEELPDEGEHHLRQSAAESRPGQRNQAG